MNGMTFASEESVLSFDVESSLHIPPKMHFNIDLAYSLTSQLFCGMQLANTERHKRNGIGKPKFRKGMWFNVVV